MIPSEVRSLSASQWLQGLSAKGAPSQTGAQSNMGSRELPRDSASISARAFQLNQAAGTSLKTDSQATQSSGVSATHPHYRYPSSPHQSSDNQTGKTSVVDSVAQAGVSDSQRVTGNGSVAASSDPHSGSFIQELARKAANDVHAAYSHITAPEAAPSPNRGSRSISVTA
jgi:hypothetical protein